MKKLLMLMTLYLLFSHAIVWAQPIPNYYSRYNLLMAPSAAFQEGLAGYANPANLLFLQDFEMRFGWTTKGTDAASLNNWGIFTGYRGVGFSAYQERLGRDKVTDYRFATGFGSEGFAVGLAYGWSQGDRDAFGRERLISAGSIIRPNKFLSFGLTGHFSLQSDQKEGIAEIGIRPLGTPFLTLFADAAVQKNQRISDAPWSAGAALQVLKGIHFVGRYFESKTMTFGLAIDFGRGGVSGQSHFDNDRNHQYNSYMIRQGGLKSSVFTTLFEKQRRFLSLDFKGEVDYLNYVIVDKGTHRFLDLLKNIRAAVDDPRVGAVALNLTESYVMPEHAWEIREELVKVRKAGKKVVAFLENGEMTDYYLASVADVIVMDPEGVLMLPGYIMSRTFLKGTLEKLGLGFDEWRFFKYKSAAEVLSRDQFSEADREQRQAYIDDWYEMVRSDIMASRKMTQDEFDRLIDQAMLFNPENALKYNLIDTLGRWSALDEVVKSVMKKSVRSIPARDLIANALMSPEWGGKPKIALVYGLGECAMETGIKARWLEQVFLNLEKDNSVRAVVFRVDSPGGDAMASDLVAEALKKCSKKKPVIISQGQVAGSGGYWISMYGQEIIAGPNTVTGSIGVIGGWLYDKGVSEKLGMTSDYVKRGDHADFMSGVTLPLIGVTIPKRNLTDEERAEMEKFIRAFYDTFVNKVASGRGLAEDKVREIAEGHFYSGLDGHAIGLVDEIGGMLTAMAIAQQKAGIKPEADVNIIEIPRTKGFFKSFLPGFSMGVDDDVMRYLKMVSQHPGQPLPMMVPGSYPGKE
jgi:protease IV